MFSSDDILAVKGQPDVGSTIGRLSTNDERCRSCGARSTTHWKGVSKELVAAMGKFNEEMAQAGVLLAAEGLHPSSKGARVKFSTKSAKPRKE